MDGRDDTGGLRGDGTLLTRRSFLAGLASAALLARSWRVRAAGTEGAPWPGGEAVRVRRWRPLDRGDLHRRHGLAG